MAVNHPRKMHSSMLLFRRGSGCMFCSHPLPGRRESFCSEYCVAGYWKLVKTSRALMRRDMDRCQGCLAPGEEIDHVLAVRHGGGCSGAWNLILYCRECHLKRRDRKPAPEGIAEFPKVLLRNCYSKDPEVREQYYRMGPMLTRADRVRCALIDYRKHPDREDFASRLFWELEVLQEQLLILHRCMEYRPLQAGWIWCHDTLSYLHTQHGFQLQLPIHMPLL